MRRIIAALLFSTLTTTWAGAQDAKPVELQPDAPDRHIVVPGDTLWGIAAQFLKDPYRWPEVWRLNPEQIKNPHRIYPGQVVVLDRSGASPQLKLGELIKAEPKVYSSAVKQEIPAIPQDEIEPFLSRPLVIEDGGLEDAPRIVATEENRLHVGAGSDFFAVGIKGTAPLWYVYRQGQALKDPETGALLGYEAIYLGTARKTADGDVATFHILSSKQEIGTGDRLVPVPKPDVISYVPHAPQEMIRGRVISVYGGVGEGASFSVVSLTKGKADGLEIGHVLALYRSRTETVGRVEGDTKEYKLPEQRYGLVFVFRVFDHVSYALVMSVTRPLAIGDVVRTP